MIAGPALMLQLQIQGPGAAGGIESPGVLVHPRHHHRHLQQRLQIRIALRQIRSGSDNKRNATPAQPANPCTFLNWCKEVFRSKRTSWHSPRKKHWKTKDNR